MLKHISHRPWPLPQKPWMMTQTWNHLLFAHWPVSPKIIRNQIPCELEIDTFDQQAWIGIVPFGMSNIRAHGLPPIPFTNRFPEINVRTYVVYRDKPGVYLFSLDAAHRLAVSMARIFYHLPYYYAKIQYSQTKGQIHYTSHRVHPSAPVADFQAVYCPISDVFQAQKGSLDYWLTERYCLYTTHKKRLYRCDIHHLPWSLQYAEAEIIYNTMATSHQILLPDIKPILHYSETCKVLIWSLIREI